MSLLRRLPLPRRPSAIAALLSLAAIGGFLLWYAGSGRPLSAAESEAFMERVRALDAPARTFLTDVVGVDAFMRADDGAPFYVVNLTELRDAAGYADGRAAVSGSEAYAEFGRRMLPLWLARASHPVFATVPLRQAEGWDTLSVVRYRSRRDFMEMVTSRDYADALVHRLAATRDGVRLVREGSTTPRPAVALIAACAAGVLLVSAVESASARRSS